MLERITAYDPIWERAPFFEALALFNLMFRLREFEDALFVTDRETIFLAQSSSDMPAWVWTKEGVDPQSVESLLMAYDIQKMTAKASVADAMGDRWRVVHRLLGNVCETVKVPTVDGYLQKPAPAEARTIAQGLAAFDRETSQGSGTIDVKMEEAKRLLEDPDFLLWRTPSGEPASFAMVGRRSQTHTRIRIVFTYPHLRGRGYAGAVVAECCKRIFAEGCIPMLYTDALYPSSNRAYQKVGFVPVGELCTVERTR